MPLSRSRDYLSIGEVLEAIRPDFPDVSISKIRFLESEGLINPERTESGYRKFYEDDVVKLRRILALQRDHFLPLRVIRDRLEEPHDSQPAAPAPPPEGDRPREPEIEMTRDELVTRGRLSEEQFESLVEYGILEAKSDYDRFDLTAARAAAGLFRFGIEPRHLRMYRQFAEREASFFEQIVAPVTRRKDESAQEEARLSLGELRSLSHGLREALLSARLRTLI